MKSPPQSGRLIRPRLAGFEVTGDTSSAFPQVGHLCSVPILLLSILTLVTLANQGGMLHMAKKKISWGAGQNAKKVAQFIIHVGGRTHGVGDLGLEPFPVAFSQAMHRHSRRAFGHV